jgi:hypothetical protein
MVEYSQATIDAQRKIVKNLDRKLKSMGSLVPPPIRAGMIRRVPLIGIAIIVGVDLAFGLGAWLAGLL